MLVSLLENPNQEAKQEFSAYLVQICDFMEQTLQIEGFGDSQRLLNICSLMMDMSKLNSGN